MATAGRAESLTTPVRLNPALENAWIEELFSSLINALTFLNDFASMTS